MTLYRPICLVGGKSSNLHINQKSETMLDKTMFWHYIKYGKICFHQIVSINMDSDNVSFDANSFLFSY